MKYLKLLVIACLGSTQLFAQGLTLAPASQTVTGSADDLAEVTTVLTNLGPSQTITWKRITDEIPDLWISSVCDLTTCWADTQDQPGSPFTMTNGQAGTVYVKFDARNFPSGPSIPGTGYVQVHFYSVSDSANYNVLGAFTADLSATGFFTPSADNTFAVYPNPAVGSVNYMISNTNNLKSIDVLNIVGKKVSGIQVAAGVVTGKIDLSSLPDGIYFVRFVDKNDMILATKKLSVSN